MPARKIRRPVALQVARAYEPRRRNPRAVDAARERLFSEMAMLHKLGLSTRILDNAHLLLTRSWSAASWKTREDLLKAAEWLICLERERGIQPFVGSARRRRPLWVAGRASVRW